MGFGDRLAGVLPVLTVFVNIDVGVGVVLVSGVGVDVVVGTAGAGSVGTVGTDGGGVGSSRTYEQSFSRVLLGNAVC